MGKTHILRTREGTREVTLTPLRAIRSKCMDCSGWQRKEVKECQQKTCPLWPYRGWWNYGEKRRTPRQELTTNKNLKGGG